MQTIVIENRDHQQSTFLAAARQLSYLEVVGVFDQWEEAREFLLRQKVQLVVLDIQALREEGITMGQNVRAFFPEVKLLYITDADTYHYVLAAVRANSGAYILKPYTAEDLDYAVNASRLFQQKLKKRIFARTFGHFDLFIDNVAVAFKSSKSRELLALLIDRQGGVVTSDQAIGTLWEYRANDNATQSLYSKVGKALQEQLEESGAGDLILSSRGSKSINVDKLDCDLYQFLDGDETAKQMFFGQYMVDYSWAEYRLPGLMRYWKS